MNEVTFKVHIIRKTQKSLSRKKGNKKRKGKGNMLSLQFLNSKVGGSIKETDEQMGKKQDLFR